MFRRIAVVTSQRPGVRWSSTAFERRVSRNHAACRTFTNRRYSQRMSLPAEKVAEVLALPAPDRAYLAHQLIASLDPQQDADAEAKWHEVIDRRSREIEEGKVACRPVDEVVQDIRAKLNAHRQPS